MAKKRAKTRGLGLVIFLAIYGILGVTGMFFGLKWFWHFMKAYEASRPHVAIEAYMENLTPEKILDACDDLIVQADSRIQTYEECRRLLLDAIGEELTYARKASACTETMQTYVVRGGSQVLGTFVIEAGVEDRYGFTPWHLKEESFDLSRWMGSEILSVTVPQGCTVWVNGKQLDERHVTEERQQEFALLEDYYGVYDVPYLVFRTYEAGPFLLADYTIEVYDAQGESFTLDENFDENSLIELGDQDKIRTLDDFVEEFIDIYVIFAGCANDARYDNYERVIPYVVPGSSLASRMENALEGMQFAQSRGDEVASIQVNHYVELEPGRYLCDVTYKVDTRGREGVVQTTTNAKLILVENGGKLLVESMMGY